MRLRVAVLAAAAWLAAVSTGLAQLKEPIGRGAFDLRATSSGLPVTPGWTPAVPVNTEVPSRTLGLDVGGHVYVVRLPFGALGVGGSWLIARGTVSPQLDTGTTTTTPTPPAEIPPTVTTRVTALTPQLSLNFGHALGWSYLSAGVGRAKVESEATAARGSTQQFVPVASDWVTNIHYGGGARWFINDHVGVGFDLRWHRLGSFAGTAAAPGGGRTTLFTAGAGITLK